MVELPGSLETTIPQLAAHEPIGVKSAIKGFPLLKLPQEIRDAIYKAWLQFSFAFKDGDVQWNFPNVQILRVSRQVHAEARDVLWKENLFVRFSATSPFFDDSLNDPTLPWEDSLKFFTGDEFVRNLPGIQECVEGEKSDDFKGCVMDYSVIHTDDSLMPVGENGTQIPTFQCIIPFSCLCNHILGAARSRPRFHKRYLHSVSLQNPFAHNPTDRLIPGSFYTVIVQEKVIREFRTLFKELFPAFDISGDISAPLRIAAITDITVVKERDPTVVLANLGTIVQKSKDLYRQKKYMAAGNLCATLGWEIQRYYQTFIGDELANVEGKDFRNALAAMRYQNALRRLKYDIKFTEEEMETPHTLNISRTHHMLAIAVHVMANYTDEFEDNDVNGTTWWPSVQQLTKMHLRSAVAWRLRWKFDNHQWWVIEMEKDALKEAEEYIKDAKELSPDNLAVKAEDRRIATWKQSIQERENL